MNFAEFFAADRPQPVLAFRDTTLNEGRAGRGQGFFRRHRRGQAVSTILIRVAVGDELGRVPAQRIRRFIQSARRRWPALTIQMREFTDGPDAPWIGVLVSIDARSEEATRQAEVLETRFLAYLAGNQAKQYRSTYFGADLSMEEASQY